MISGSNEQLQQQLKYTLLKPDRHSRWISKVQSEREDNLEERYAIKVCFKLGKSATEMYGMLQNDFRPSCMNWPSVLQWHKGFKECRESLKDDESCGRSKEINTPELISQMVRVMMPALYKSCQWHFHQHNAPFHNSILVTDYLTKMGIKTVPQSPYSPDLDPCDIWLFLKLRGCRYLRVEEMKEAGTKVIDTLTREDFHGAFQKVLELFNKCIAAGGDCFEGD